MLLVMGAVVGLAWRARSAAAAAAAGTTALAADAVLQSQISSLAEEEGACPPCAPQARVVPDVVIPFFERDLCKLKFTAKSLSVNDPDHNFGDVYLLWVSTHPSKDYLDKLSEAVKLIAATHKVHFIEFTKLMEFTDSLGGWHAQQVLKLKVASIVQSDYYVVLDSKNTLIQPLHAETLFDQCHRAKVQADFPAAKIPVPHISWYEASAKALNLSKPTSGYWPASITPVVFHKPTVLSMLAAIGEYPGIDELCKGPLCDMFGARDESGQGATEFTMYTLWAFSRDNFQCLYTVDEAQWVKVKYSEDWVSEMMSGLGDMSVAQGDFAAISVSDQEGYPLPDYIPAAAEGVPEESKFPLKFEDLRRKWAASLWRGMPENQELLTAVNMESLNAIIGGVRQSPIMFGAQPGALKAMPGDMQQEATGLIAQIYGKAGLYPAVDEDTPDELVECVVGSHNGIR